MKDFIKFTMATITGIILCSVLVTVIALVSMAGMVASEGISAPIKDKSILHINLKGVIEERANSDPFSSLLGEEELQPLALDDALQAIRKAKANDKILGIYLEGGAMGGTPAMLSELRKALVDFKESGKFIYAYGDRFSRGAYYLSSVADTICLNVKGMLDWSGLASQPIFFKDVLEKVGVKMQVFKVGTYKSAVEPYICTEMSDANREQVSSFLNSIWNNMQKDVSESRHIDFNTLQALADSTTFLSLPEKILENGFVDKLCYIDEVKNSLKALAGVDKDDDLRFVTVTDMAHSETLNEKNSDEIAVYYAYGEIVDVATPGFSQEHQIIGKDMVKDLQKLRLDDDVKAVVLRVNSPGGSAFASEQIWREVTLLKEAKPVIVSMGGMAASGGYYISCAANKIFADPTTLTGSIGIFGMIPDASELLTQKIGLKFDVVKTNAMSDFGSTGRPFNESECKFMQEYVNEGYELFTSRVADGRKMKQDDVKAIAEGRVWTGEQALERGLVNELGNLNDAIAEASKAAGTEKYSIGCYPGQEPWYNNLLNKEKSSYLDSQLETMLGDYYTPLRAIQNLTKQNPIQARMMYDPNIR